MLDNLPTIFQQLQQEYRLPQSMVLISCLFVGDFPEIESFKSIIQTMDFSTFPKYEKELFDQLDTVLTKDIPKYVLPSLVME